MIVRKTSLSCAMSATRSDKTQPTTWTSQHHQKPSTSSSACFRTVRDSWKTTKTPNAVQPIEDPTYPVRRLCLTRQLREKSRLTWFRASHPCSIMTSRATTSSYNSGLRTRIGKKDEQTLSRCLKDTYTKTLRFMMPEHNPVRCPRHNCSSRDHPYDVPHCLGCKKFLRGLQFKLIERTHHMLKKGYTFPEDHEPLPSYFPSEITNLVFPKEESKKECENCAICMDEINTKTENCVLKCGHTFHSCCLKELISKSGEVTEYGRRDCAECPLCRKNIEIQMTCDLKAAAEEQEVIEVVPVPERRCVCGE